MKRVADTHKTVLYPYSLTANVQNDYWYIWVKSGLLKYLCNKLRKKYEIPRLNEDEDKYFGEVIVGEDSVSDSGHYFFDDWVRAAEFEEELREYLVQLNLAEGAYEEIFNCVFYRKPLNAKLTWAEKDIKGQPFYDGFPGSLDELPVREFGSSRREIERYIGTTKKLAKRKGIKGMSGFFKSLGYYKLSVRGDVRQIQSRKIYLEVICQLKLYKTFQLVDRQDYDNDPDKPNLRQISEKCALRVAEKIGEDFDALDFRKLVSRLLKYFPVLKEYISQSKT